MLGNQRVSCTGTPSLTGTVLVRDDNDGKVSFTAVLISSNQVAFGTAAPGSGTWVAGDVCWNKSVASGQPEGWRCTAAGTPGTWSAMANHP